MRRYVESGESCSSCRTRLTRDSSGTAAGCDELVSESSEAPLHSNCGTMCYPIASTFETRSIWWRELTGGIADLLGNVAQVWSKPLARSD